MQNKVLNSVINLSNLPHPLKHPIVIESWEWRGMQFTIVSMEGRRKMTNYELPTTWEWEHLDTVQQAIEAWCNNGNDMHILDYLDRMFGDRYPKKDRRK